MSERVYVPISKVDTERRLVFGWANVPYPVTKALYIDALDGSIEAEVHEVWDAFAAANPERWDYNVDGSFGGGFFYCLVATYKNYIITERWDYTPEYEGSRSLWKVAYKRSGGEVKFGEAEQVEVEFVAKAAFEERVAKSEPAGRTPTTDSHGDQIYLTDLENAAYEFMLVSRTGGLEHETMGISRPVESFVATPEKWAKLFLDAEGNPLIEGISKDVIDAHFPCGWWAGWYVEDDDVWEDVKNGVYAGFSIAGVAEPVGNDE